MFMLDNKPLALDVPFTHGDIQYPANWLRLASPEERAAIGITEVADPQPYDDRFYWGPGNPKNVEMVRAMLLEQLRATAYSLLAPTDYKVVKGVELGEPVDADTLAKRAAIRAAYASNKAAIFAATSTEQLAGVQFTWPKEE